MNQTEGVELTVSPNQLDGLSKEDLINEKDGTVRDAQDMHRMGKQELFRVRMKVLE